MAFQRPLYQQPESGDPAISYTAQADRNLLIRALVSREGVFDYDSVQPIIRQRGAGANASIDVVAFRAAVVGDDVANQGTYIIHNDATLNVTGVPAPPGSGTRQHRVVAQVRDKLHNGSWTTYDVVVSVLADTGSGTPAVPSSAITLGFISQTVGQTSITTAMLFPPTQPRASVGSVDLSGTFNIHADLGTVDGTRPLRWQVDADGRVHLSGWRMRSTGTPTYAFNTLYAVTDIATAKILPAECRPSGIRDVVVASYNGPVHMAIHPDGQIYIRYVAAADSFAGTWWISFDGATFLRT
jgi:hypothetical protein